MHERKTLGQLFVPICIETLFYMLAGTVDTLMLSSVSDRAVGAVGTVNTYIGMFIIMFSIVSTGMMAVMTQNIGAGKPGIAYQSKINQVVAGFVYQYMTALVIIEIFSKLIKEKIANNKNKQIEDVEEVA